VFANAQKRSRDATPIKILTYLLVQNTHDSKNKKKQKKQQLFFGLLGPQNVKVRNNLLGPQNVKIRNNLSIDFSEKEQLTTFILILKILCHCP